MIPKDEDSHFREISDDHQKYDTSQLLATPRRTCHIIEFFLYLSFIGLGKSDIYWIKIVCLSRNFGGLSFSKEFLAFSPSLKTALRCMGGLPL